MYKKQLQAQHKHLNLNFKRYRKVASQ